MKTGGSILLYIFILCSLAVPTSSQNQVTTVTPKALYNHLKKYLGKRRNKEWANYLGKTVCWTGSPNPFHARGITDRGFLIDLISERIFIRAYFPEKDAELLSRLSEYDSVIFKGELARYSHSFGDYNFLIEDAKLIGVEKAKVLMSIIGHKYNIFKRLYYGDYEFWAFYVFLRNEGKLPLKNATLEVDFEHIRGIAKDIRVGPEEDREIRMSPWLGEWIVNGEKKKLPFHIPPGSYTGTIRLKDAKGQLIASRPFSHYLTSFERKHFPREKGK